MPDNLPSLPDDAEVESIVYEAEVIDETAPVHAVPAVRLVALHPHARVVVRHGLYVAAGVVVAVRRWHAARTRHERMMRSAEAAGDDEVALAWAQQLARERHERHERQRERVETVIAVVRAFPWILAALLVSPAVLGVFWAIARRRFTAIGEPYIWAAHVIAFGVEVASLVWSVAVVAVPLAVVAVLYHLGRHAEISRQGGPWQPSRATRTAASS